MHTPRSLTLGVVLSALATGAFADPPRKQQTIAAHADFVSGLAFSPDGSRLISSSADQTVAIFDARTGAELKRLPEHKEPIFALACSPTGNEAFVAGGHVEGGVALLDKLDIAAKREVTAVTEGARLEGYTGHDAAVISIALSFDGALLATGDLSGVIRFWKPGTDASNTDEFGAKLSSDLANSAKMVEKLKAQIEAKQRGDKGPVTVAKTAPLAELRVSGPAIALDFSSDGKLLAVATGGDQIEIFDAESHQPLRKLEVKQGKVLALLFQHATHKLAVGSADKGLALWDADGGKVVQQFVGSEGAVFALAFLNDGRGLASGGKDSQVRVWDLAAGKLDYSLPEPTGYVRALAVDRGGRRLAAGSKSGAITIYRLPFGRDLEATGQVFSAGGSAADAQLILETGEHTDRVSHALFTKDGKQVITGSWDKTVRIWDAETGEMLRAIRLPAYPGTQGMIYAMALSPDERFLAVAGASVEAEVKNVTGKGEYVTMLNLATGEIVDVIGHHLNVIFGLSFAPDGKSIATGAGDNDQKSLIYSVSPSGKMALVTGAMLPAMVLGTAYSPDSKHVFLIDGAGDLVRMEPDELSDLPLPRSSNEAITGNLQLANGSDVKACIGGVIAQSTKRRMNDMMGRPADESVIYYAVAADPTGKWVAAGDALGIVTLTPQDLGLKGAPQGETLFLIPKNAEQPGSVGSLMFNRDGTRVVASIGKFVDVVDVATKKVISTFTLHDNTVFSAAFSPDGKRVVSSSGNGASTYIWDAETGKLLVKLGGKKALPTVWALAGDAKNGAIIGIGNKTASGHEDPNDYGAIEYGFDFNSLRVLATLDATALETSLQSNARAQALTPGFVPNQQTIGTKMLSWLALPDGREVIGTEFGAHYRDPYVKSLDLSGVRANAMALGGDRGQTFYVGFADGRIGIYDTASMKLVATLLITAEREWVLFTPDGYYAASKSGAKSVGWLMNHGVQKSPGFYPFEQLDLRLNRPDVVLTRLRYPGMTEATLTALKSAREKRLKKMGVSEAALAADASAPKLLIARVSEVSKSKKIELEISVASSVAIDRLNVYADDVPIFGVAGLSVKNENATSLKKKIPIELTAGRNKLQVSALDVHGAESAKETVYVTYTGKAPLPDLYVLSIGVSEYDDAQWKLDYAAKDAADLAAALGKASSGFGKINVQTLLDKQVTKEAVTAARKFLARSRPDDQVVLFLAGHGLLDAKDDYYFGTVDIAFADPAARGLPYDAIESLLDGIPARHKLLLMDTCHSGEVDKDELAPLAASSNTSDGKLLARVPGTRGFKRTGTTSVSSEALNGLLGSLFTDLRRGSGAMVISSASGQQLAIEGNGFKNGVFTYALLQGLESKQADANHDDAVTVAELRDYVISKVTLLTQGQQTPTSRRENLDFDFNVIQYAKASNR
jgi:WD40 repeat protein/uncharacterized caspase-like protein